MPKYRVKRHAVVQPENEAYRLIPLTQNQNAIVDADDYEFLMQWNWIAHRNRERASFYAIRKTDQDMQITMQEQITGRKNIDHKNRNGLDNRKGNLRECSESQQQANRRKAENKTSQYRGVSWDSDSGKWKAEISPNRIRIRLGRFISERQAARAYDAAARHYFGEFASTNFPD